MDLADFQKVDALITEKRAIQRTLAVFAAGGRIIGMTVGAVPDDLAPPTSVATAYINYPPQMVDAIRTAFTEREQQITQELGQLGVTGI